MKRKHLIKRLLLTLGFLCTMGLGMANTETTITHYPDSNVEYTLNKGFSTESGFTAGTITISDGETTITMLDRNLGATSNDINSISSYGYHFQRGNNYGFRPCIQNQCGSFPGLESTSRSIVEIFGPSEYYISKYSKNLFRIGSHNRMNEAKKDLWGGSTSDFISSLDGDNWKVNNASDRQGPCPQHFHVPSYGELIKMKKMVGETGFYLLFPPAGYRDYYAGIINGLGFNYPYWTSTYGTQNPYSLDQNFFFYVSDTTMGFPIRCLYDSYETYTQFSSLFVSFLDEDGATQIWSGEVESGTILADSGTVTAILSGYQNSKTGYTFNGWIISGTDTAIDLSDPITTGLELVASWTMDTYNLSIDLNGGTLEAGATNPTSYNVESDDITLKNPVREGYTFAGWTGTDLITPEVAVTIAKGSTGDREYFANWTEKPRPTSGGGGSSLKKDNCPNGDYSDSYYDGICGNKDFSSQTPQNDSGEVSLIKGDGDPDLSGEPEGFNQEQIDAYTRAYKNGITTMDTIEKSDMGGSLTRIAMAKMLSKYAINVLGKKPANKIVPEFSDITEELNAEYDGGVTLAYQLGIMGINMPDNKFRPFDLVTRAEFGTALSRLIFGIADGEEVYYTTHLAKLKAEGIITNDDPTLEELRGYVMLMLMRSAK